MVVVVIGIVIGIAVPIFAGVRDRSEDRAVQMNLDVARARGEEEALFGDEREWPENLGQILTDPQLNFTDQAVIDDETVGVAVGEAGGTLVAVYVGLAGEERCWVLVDRGGDGVGYGQLVGGECDPAEALGVAAQVTAESWNEAVEVAPAE